MNNLRKYLYYLCIASLIVGPLGVIPLGIPGINLYFADIIVCCLCITWIPYVPQIFKLMQKDKVFVLFGIFVTTAIFSLIVSPIQLSLQERFISLLYLLRFTSYAVVYMTCKYLHKEKMITTTATIFYLGTAGTVVSLFGWLQYVLYPDLRNLYYLGWDPHYLRIFSTYFDPNYLGLLLVLTLLALFFSKPILRIWIARIVVLVTLAFTYSRSSFLSLLAAAVYYSIIKSRILLTISTIVFLALAVVLLPRPGGEGVKLERIFSIEQRIVNWQQAYKIFSNHPVLGVGFNTVRYTRKQYGLISEDWMTSHSQAGFDNSLLFVLATTGIVGMFSYGLFLTYFFLQGNILVKTSFVAVLIHSIFLNSLFFPFIMLWMWILAGTGRNISDGPS